MQRTKYRGIYVRKNQDGSSSYYVRCTLGGKQTWRRAGSTVSEAKRFQEAVRQAQARERLGFKLPERKRFRELTDMYVEDYLKRKGDKNYARIRSAMKMLNNHFGDMYVAAITEIEIDQANIPRSELIMLKAVLGRGKRWGFLSEVPEIIMPRRSKKLDRTLSDEELDLILSQASELHRDAILLSLGLGGMRLGELTMITRDNTDFKAATIELQERKADQPKRYALTETAAKILRRRFMANGGKAFTQTPGKLSQMFLYERQKMKGVKPWRFHDLRHTVTQILKGIDVETLREILGHTSIKTTSLYMHSNLEEQREALRTVQHHLTKVVGSIPVVED